MHIKKTMTEKENKCKELLVTKNINIMPKEYSHINREVMLDTERQYIINPELQEAVLASKRRQYIVLQEDNIDQPKTDDSSTKYIVSGKRSFEAAKDYQGKKIAVLNFANNHSVGGAPFSAGAQEESLCRCSTLYACLGAMKSEFHDKHREQYMRGEINYMGNDDLIYTPDVVVFKTEEPETVTFLMGKGYNLIENFEE